jgi:hypothetical protein
MNVTDSVTGITWRAGASTGRAQADADAYCSGLSKPGATYRLATRLEVVSLMNYGEINAKLDGAAFPDVKSPDMLWTSTPDEGSPPMIAFWSVVLGCSPVGACSLDQPDFSGPGITHSVYTGAPGRALCVLEEQSPPMGPLSVPDTGDVIPDPRTGRTWERTRASAGMTWLAALKYCQAQAIGGEVDWRLPSIKELQTIVDDSPGSPALYWDAGSTGFLWSSTPSPDVTDGVYVLFAITGSTLIQRSSVAYNHVLCVRGAL